MNHVIIILVLISPGYWEWDRQEYESYELCHEAVHALRDRNPEAKPWHRFYEYLIEGAEYSGTIFEDWCKGEMK